MLPIVSRGLVRCETSVFSTYAMLLRTTRSVTTRAGNRGAILRSALDKYHIQTAKHVIATTAPTKHPMIIAESHA